MTFRQILEKIVDETPGACAASIMASDGIPVDEFAREDAGVDLASLAVEFQQVLEQSRKVAGALYGNSGGGLEELILVTDVQQIFFRQIDDEFFVAIALERTGVLGKARYLVRSLLDNLREEL